MECDRALEALSEAIDLGPAAVPDHAEALAHCAACPGCARAAEALRRLGSIPAPEAPAGLVERVLAAAEQERAAQAPQPEQDASPAEGGGPTLVVPLTVPVRTPSRFRTAALVMAGAAVLFGAFVVMRAGIVTMTGDGTRTATELGIEPVGANGEAVPPPPLPKDFKGDVTSGPGADEAQSARTAPNLIAFGGWVYRAAPDVRAPERSALTTLGQTTTDLGSGSPGTHAVLGLQSAPQAIYLDAAAGKLMLFAIVTRTFGGERFALQADTSIARYGDWALLPSRFPAPTAADGGPTFRAHTKPDDVGATVYPLPGSDPSGGFAIPPGLPATDPGSGNPNWTWWAPAP
ncbi:MAG: hypothetical protein C0418_00950 [Coriobacteriaceae bacterium]|nr:hypothetical protein [Coriobacteriaceae bacterium]